MAILSAVLVGVVAILTVQILEETFLRLSCIHDIIAGAAIDVISAGRAKDDVIAGCAKELIVSSFRMTKGVEEVCIDRAQG